MSYLELVHTETFFFQMAEKGARVGWLTGDLVELHEIFKGNARAIKVNCIYRM